MSLLLIKSFKRYWRVLVNLAFSALVFSFLISKYWNYQILNKLVNVNLVFICSAILILMALSGLQLLRWRICLNQLGEAIEWWLGLRILFVGCFFNQTLPSSVGGDFFRIWLVNRAGIPLHASIVSVIADRIAALFGLFALCIFLSPLLSRLLGIKAAFQIASICLILFASPAVFNAYIEKTLGKFESFVFFKRLISLFRGVKLTLGKLGPTSKMLALSASMHLISGFSFFLIAKSIGINISFMACVCLFPFIILATVLPISFAGWGVREGAAIIVFSHVGVSPGDALSVSVLFGIILAISGMPGALLWIFRTTPIISGKS